MGVIEEGQLLLYLYIGSLSRRSFKYIAMLEADFHERFPTTFVI